MPGMPGMPMPDMKQAGENQKFGQGPEMLREPWLFHFVGREEKEQIVAWMHQEGLERPRGFDDRICRAEYLKQLGNDMTQREDYRRALHCALAAIHCLDFCPLEQQGQSEEQRQQVAQTMLPVLCNFTWVFLKRGDWENADKAATSGLLCAEKLPPKETSVLRAKLFYRRALARAEKGPQRDYEKSHADLIEAAKLDPTNHDIRSCLDRCKELEKEERRDAFLKGPRYGGHPDAKKLVSEKGEEEQSYEDGDKHNPGKAAELSPPLEFCAMCIGRSLRIARRGWLRTSDGLEQCREALKRQRWLFTVVILSFVIGFARYTFIATEGTPRKIALGATLLVTIFLCNVLGMQVLGIGEDSCKAKVA